MAGTKVVSAEIGDHISRGNIVGWWEIRRVRYNLIVGCVGLISIVLVLVAGSAAVKTCADFEEPLGLIVGPIVFGVMANLFYTIGWIVDIIAYRGTPRVKLFRLGLIFSSILASLPGVWAVTAWLITVWTGKKLD